MNESTIKAAFEDWWRDSYGTPPGTHAVMTHTAFAEHIIQLLELLQDAEATEEQSLDYFNHYVAGDR